MTRGINGALQLNVKRIDRNLLIYALEMYNQSEFLSEASKITSVQITYCLIWLLEDTLFKQSAISSSNGL